MVAILTLVILDNASVHKGKSTLETISGVGTLVRFLPPYSPDQTPIEELFAEVKGYLKANDAVLKATSSPAMLITMAFGSVTKDILIMV